MFFSKLVLSLCLFLAISLNAVTGQARLVNGAFAIQPPTFMASIQQRKNQGPVHRCGGVIIGIDIVLTATSCLIGIHVEDLSVLAGVADLSSNLGTRHNVQGYVLQNYFSLGNNIAVIKVTPPFVLDARISAKDFSSNSTVEVSDVVYLYGYGAIDPTGQHTSNRLRELRTAVRNYAFCRAIYRNLNETAICTYKTLAQGICKGDAGGPVISALTDELVGIISYGTSPCGIGYPDVCTRLSVMTDWIKDAIQSLA